jgi:hypothetical protein
LKLSSVASDLLGKSSRDMLDALVAGVNRSRPIASAAAMPSAVSLSPWLSV